MAPAAAKTEDKAVEEKSAVEPGKGKKLIRYIGTSDVREIDHAAWKARGIDQTKLRFEQSNNWRMTDEGISPDAVEYFATVDDGFVVTDVG